MHYKLHDIEYLESIFNNTPLEKGWYIFLQHWIKPQHKKVLKLQRFCRRMSGFSTRKDKNGLPLLSKLVRLPNYNDIVTFTDGFGIYKGHIWTINSDNTYNIKLYNSKMYNNIHRTLIMSINTQNYTPTSYYDTSINEHRNGICHRCPIRFNSIYHKRCTTTSNTFVCVCFDNSAYTLIEYMNMKRFDNPYKTYNTLIYKMLAKDNIRTKVRGQLSYMLQKILFQKNIL